MKSYEATSMIEATPDAIWPVLTDGSKYADWDSGVERLEEHIAPGETIKVFVKVNPGRAFPVKVTEFQPGQMMRWSGGMPLGLFKRRTHLHPDSARERRDEVHDAGGVLRSIATHDLGFNS